MANYIVHETLFSALLGAVGRFGRNRPDQWQDPIPGRYGYGDLLRMALALGRLGARETDEGEHVGLLMPNVVPTVGLIIGLSAFRRVPCMLNYSAGTEGMQRACRAAGIRTVITSRVFLARAGLIAQAQALQDVRLIYLEDLRKGFGPADKLWLLAYALRFPRHAVPRQDPEAPAVVLFTSGSEGKPKGVVLSHRAILSNVAQVLAVLEFGPRDVVINCLPIFHSLGLTAGVFIPLVCGARLVFYTTPLHFKVIPELVRDHGGTVLFSTGTFLNHYARHGGYDDFRSLRCVVAGAEKLGEPIRRLWQDKFGIDVLEGYGVTETAPVLAVNRPQDNRPGTVGRLLPGIEARLVPVPGIAGGGALHVTGPNLMSGYFRGERPGVLEPPRSSVGEGWHDTGDVAEIDADGYVHILGRLKRFAKVAGEMISLEIAEAIARAASTEAMHAATCVTDLERGEAIVLFTTDPQLGRDQLLATARRLGHPELAVPKRIRVVDSLPLLGSGKVDCVRLKEMAAS